MCTFFSVPRINAVSNAQVRGDSYSDGCLGRTGKSKIMPSLKTELFRRCFVIWLFFSLSHGRTGVVEREVVEEKFC